ncbi:MAG: 2-C-methyl-D-erythritol 4-phosphate cytidylyltransferase, partial [Faecalibacterium prausnitzii]
DSGRCLLRCRRLAVPVKDTIKRAKGGDGATVPEGCMVENTPDRSTLYAVQTPQCSTGPPIWRRWMNWIRPAPASSPTTAACSS